MAAQTRPAPGLSRLGQIAMPVRDVPRATRFYRDVLGMPLLFEAGGMAFFDNGGVRLMLAQPEKGDAANAGSVLYYKVDDIHQAYESLAAGGVEFIDKPHLIAKMSDHDLWMVFLRDGEGNTLALMSEMRR